MNDALAAATSGIAGITLFDTDDLPSRLAAEVRAAPLEDYVETRQTYLDRASEFALIATQLALDDAGLTRESVTNAALHYGTAQGCMDTMALFYEDLASKGPRLVKPFLFPHTYANTPISLIAIEYGICGYHSNYTSGAVASGCALLEAYDRVRSGRDDLTVAGGVDAISAVTFEGLGELGLLSPGNGGTEHCAPFGERRNGTVLGEGAVSIVLEPLDHALDRGAPILAEITGAGIAAGCAPDDLADTVRRSLAGAACDGAVGAVCAGANGSIDGDLWLAQGIRDFLHERNIPAPVTSITPLTGDTRGCATAMQMVAATQMLSAGSVIPTCNSEPLDAAIDLDVPAVATHVRGLDNIMVTTADSGGTVVSFLVKRYAGKGGT